MDTKMSMNRLALSNLRVRRRQYISLTMGIMMAVFFVSTILLAGQSIMQSSAYRYQRQMGSQDAILYDAERINDQDLLSVGFASQVGTIRVIEQETGTGINIGSYDETAEELLTRRMIEGRMPQAPGEIAIEQDALYRIDREVKIGDRLSLRVKAVNSPKEAEEKAYTVVGILFPQTIMQHGGSVNRVRQSGMPRALVSPAEEAALGGRPMLHKVVQFGRGVSAKAFDHYLEREYGDTFGVDHFGFQLFEPSVDSSAKDAIPLTAILGSLLVMSACMAVSNAFGGMLAERRSQIGMMRAIGATYRQIWQIFLREALILTLLTAPAGIGLSMLVIKGASLVAGDVFVFHVSPWFIPAALLISLAVVVLSALVPLWSFKRLSPMQVIRDSGLLRSKKRVRIQEKTAYKVPALLAKRQLQLYRLRQFGVTLTLALSFAILTFGFNHLFAKSISDANIRPDFDLGLSGYSFESFFDKSIYTPVISEADAANISRLPYIDKIEARKELTVNLLSDKVSDYLIKSGFGRWYLEDRDDSVVDSAHWDIVRKNYDELLRQQNISNQLVEAELNAFDEAYIQGLENLVIAGSIDMEEINAGREVLVFAPAKVYIGWLRQENGLRTPLYDYWMDTGDRVDYTGVLENDQFYAGDTLNFIRLTKEFSVGECGSNDYLTGVSRTDHAVKIGAILGADQENERWIADETGAIITSVQGLDAMGIHGVGYARIQASLSPSAPPEAVEYDRAALNDIVTRSEGIRMNDNELAVREAHRSRQIMNIAIIFIIFVFFMMVVNFVNSAMTMRVKSDKRAIGTLRAVGAQMADILKSYRLQVWMMLSSGVVIGLMITVGMYFAFFYNNKYMKLTIPFPVLFAVQAVFIGLLSLVCGMLLSARLRQVTKASIVDNIREL